MTGASGSGRAVESDRSRRATDSDRAGATDPTDAELVSAARRGDPDALEKLLRRHHDRLHRLCRRLCPDRGDAEDATQEALIAIVRGLERYDGRAAFTTWSYRVATNACLDQLRRRGRRPVPADPGLHADGAPAPAATEPGVAPVDPGDHAVASEARATIADALDALPEEFRTPVVLRDVADLDYAEIAALLDLPPGTVRSRISRGRARLAELLPPHLRPRASTGNPTEPADVRTLDEP